ncbi:sulfite exporter TauE/SafE family protein [Gloeobacter morelensis]|uniref:Probable membrane transporter protein n=1 Tax=Gloeobacter morelensis MG652769 TaxID=2781736 RepID=A0ABY3PSE5_9CYAN|nr:sulfite exporter TauE/SafE family protein [Gloeobacter morelensis]UFP96552.1 sulfite exporter TauE/SafE family protein [Gloeobacter morelensis MG652769]
MAGGFTGQPTLLEYALVVLAGCLAVAINTLAGGGSLLSFPVLLFLGMPPIAANATNAVGLSVGGISAVLGFGHYYPSCRRRFWLLVVPTVPGALGGAWLLAHTSEALFGQLVPVLIAAATALLALQDRIKRWSTRRWGTFPGFLGLPVQFAVAVYGGYFGAGMGILIMACLGLYLEGSLHEHNAIKTWLQWGINGAASVLFVVSGLVDPAVAACLIVGGLFGGWAAAILAERIEPMHLRRLIVGLGAVLCVWFILRP